MAIFPDSIMNRSEMSLESIAAKLTYFHEQLHLLHWQTQGYAEHMALGSLYEYIHDFRDGVIEKLMGYMGKRPAPYKIEPLINTSPVNVVTELIAYAASLRSFADMNGYLDVGSLADSLSGEAAKTKYLLSLT